VQNGSKLVKDASNFFNAVFKFVSAFDIELVSKSEIFLLIN